MQITGSGRGIGKATALAFAKAGANVMITARTQKDVDKTAQECRQLGVKVGSFAANGTILSDLENLVKQVRLPHVPIKW
jgi:NAD(P)-dependent dehydrogenase (short-subunit alcohol dehydrogenase family)